MTDTRDQLIALVSEALGAKTGHDLGKLPTALRHLEAVHRQAAALHAQITTELNRLPRKDAP